MRDACVPRRVDELHVCLLVISLQHLQTLLGDAFDTLLFLLLCIDMIIEYGSTEFDDSVLRGAVGSENLPPMIADNAELFDVLMLRATLAVNALPAFVLFCRANIAQKGFADTTEICTAEGQERAMGQTLSNEGAESTLLVKDLERFEFDHGAKLSMSGIAGNGSKLMI
jgi:hypothetical protein